MLLERERKGKGFVLAPRRSSRREKGVETTK